MCVVTDRGNQCLLDWGRWAARDSTVKRLGYPGRSAEQMAGRVSCGDFEVNDVAELVDKLVVSMLEERKRLVVCLFYVERLPVKVIVDRLLGVAKERDWPSTKVSVDVVKRDLDVIRSMVGGVVLWCS
jgi:hypothetical protein